MHAKFLFERPLFTRPFVSPCARKRSWRMLTNLCTFGLLIALAVGPAHARQSGFEDRQVAAEQLTQSLLALNARLQHAPPERRTQLIDDLHELAADRQTLLMSLIEEQPGAVLRVALPSHVRDRLQSPVRETLEFETEIEGKLTVLHIDHVESSKTHFAYTLQTAVGERFSLHFASMPPGLASGNKISAKGLLLINATATDAPTTDGAVAINSGKDDVTLLAAGDETVAAAPVPPAGYYSFGEQRTLVILVNFQDQPDEQPWTLDDVQNTVLNDTSDFFMENSYGQAWLNGDVVGWYTIPMASTVCDYWALGDLANDAAASNGIDLSTYNRTVFAFPRNACSWAGMGMVGGSITWTWLNGYMTVGLAGHEMGHNLGLWHSASLECGDDIIEGTCSTQGYGDKLDTMGSSPSGHFNAFQKERLGWLGYDASPPIITVEANGTYTIEPYETAGGGAKALKILRSTDATSGAKTWYYVEHRQAIGFDDFLTGNVNVLNGAVVHRGTDNNGKSGVLLDMTPGSNPSSDFSDPALIVGQSFNDPGADVTITTEWVEEAGAAIQVSMGPLPCIPGVPSVSLSPSESQWVEPGSLVIYQVTVVNHDSIGCGPATFDLSVNVLAGWTATFAESSLQLEPGGSGASSIEITSPISATDGFYNIDISATNSSDTAYTNTERATYVVSAPVNQTPIAVDDTAATTENTSVTIHVLANDHDPEDDPLAIASVQDGAHGEVVINADNSLNYNPQADFFGYDSFTYSISDGVNGSSSATVTVQVIAANEPPIAHSDVATTSKHSAVVIAVLANDIDYDGDPLSVLSVTQGSMGKVTINGDSTVTYTPGKRFSGNDSFTYVISDGQSTASAEVNIGSSSDDSGGKGGGKGGKGKR